MKLFEAVKEAVTARSAAEYYGIKVGRNGMAVCPFHPDKNPSMKLDKRYHCFACQADGDVIDFVAKYFNLSVKESAEKLAEDFSVPYEKYQSYNKTKDYQKPKQKKQTLDQFFHEQQIRFFRVYSDYFHLLKKWKVEYAPRIEDDDWHPLFVEAMEKYTLIEYKMDVLLSGSLEDRARLILDCQEEVKNIEQRIKENLPGDVVARLEALQKVEEVTEETQVEKNLPKMELPIWFDGKQINEILLYQTILQQHEIKCINGILYDIDRSIPNDEMEKKILNIIEHYWTSGISAKVTAILSGFKMYTRSDPLSIKEDRVHFKNGTYFVNQKFINQKEWTQNRLTVNYNKDAPKPEKWLAFLDGLLEADDIVCLQEFMGYCLIPSNRGQKMLLIIGKGGEGKSRIGRILKRIFGHNMNSGSLQKLETDKFARADQEGKLLYLDDDMKTEALPSTNVIKAIVTAEDEMDLEKKNKQSYQGLLVCRILAFGNGTLKSLFDRSQGFYRRQIILETKDVPPDRINDPYLADKMMEEVEGIVLWCIEGLERLIRNDYQFTISNKSQLLMNEMREDDDNILSFLESTGYIGLEKGTHATSKDLYVAYCRWCNDNLDVPVSERSFARRFKERSADYGMTYDKNISVGNGRFCRGFRGVHVKVRTKDVNY